MRIQPNGSVTNFIQFIFVSDEQKFIFDQNKYYLFYFIYTFRVGLWLVCKLNVFHYSWASFISITLFMFLLLCVIYDYNQIMQAK